MAHAYPELLRQVMPGVRRTRAAVAASLHRLDSSISNAETDRLPPVLQRSPDAGDCLIAALATVLRRGYEETATLLGFPCDPATARPSHLPAGGLAIGILPAKLLATGLSTTILFSTAFAGEDRAGTGVDTDTMRRPLVGRRAVVMVAGDEIGRGAFHALAWDGNKMMDCRGPELRTLLLADVELMAVAVIR